MAKRQPMPTLQQMEAELGYSVDQDIRLREAGQLFYADLTLFYSNIYDRARKEYQNLHKPKISDHHEDVEAVLNTVDEKMSISSEFGSTTVSRTHFIGYYQYFADLQYNFGLKVPFLLTAAEALAVVFIPRLVAPRRSAETQSQRSGRSFLELPRELRETIYSHVLVAKRWCIGEDNEDRSRNICRALGDLKGFYFPYGEDATLLSVNRQIRDEALPIAYRKTTVHANDIDDATRILIAIGSIGRENVESLGLCWESEVDSINNGRKCPAPENNHLILPALHVSTCIALIKQCRRLRRLRLMFESSIMAEIPQSIFQSDPGIALCCTIRGIEQVEILGYAGETLEELDNAKWLASQMTRSNAR